MSQGGPVDLASLCMSFGNPAANPAVCCMPAVLEDELLLETEWELQLLRVWFQNTSLKIGNIHIKSCPVSFPSLCFMQRETH